MRIIRFALIALTLLVTGPALAQEEEDKGFLTRQIQNLLSGAGRDVSITGFTGALSSEASFDRMTISDDDGVWLTLEDVVLDWNRSALLRGRLVVRELSASRIDLARLPEGGEDTLPDAEATPFTLPTLPDLPVSIDIAALNVAQLTLGAPVLGEAVALEMTARATLNDDGLDLAFEAARTDGTRGSFDVTAVLARGEETLDLAVVLSEQEGGLIGDLLNIPDEPAIDMRITTTGPLDNLVTQLQLNTDGEERLVGQVDVITQGRSDDPDRRVIADIGGDLTAVILPQYRDFFGPEVKLTADALIEAGGAIALDTFDLEAAAVDLSGRLRLSESGWPAFIDVQGSVARGDGAPVLLPGGGGDTRVGRINLDVDYDAANGDAYEAVFIISNLQTSEGDIAQTTLRSTGTLTGAQGNVGQLQGAVQFAAQRIALVDAALAEAVGDRLDGSLQVNYLTDAPLRITDLNLDGTSYGLTGDIAFDGIGSGLEIALGLVLTADDLSRFSALAGRELDGATQLSLEGDVTALSGVFDLRAEGVAEDIKTGIAQADALLAGRTDVQLRAIRNENGTFLRDLELNNPALRFTGAAELSSGSSRVDADINLRDISVVLPQYDGPVTLTGAARQSDLGWRVDVQGSGPYEAEITLEGLATGPQAALEFAARVPDVSRFAAQVPGALNAEGTLRQTPQGWLLQTDASGPYNASARLNGLVAPSVDLGFEVALPEVSRIAPQVRGPLRASGRLRQTDEGFAIQTDASGPYNADLSVTGALTPALDIQFDVALPNVQPLVPSVNGPLRASGQLRQTDNGFEIQTDVSGPYDADLSVTGALTPALDIQFDVALPNVQPLVPSVNGPLRASGQVRQTDQGFVIDTTAQGPYGARAQVEGLATGPDMALSFDVSVPNVAPLAPGVNGPLAAQGTLRQTPSGLSVDTNATGPYGSRASVRGVVTGPQPQVNFDFAMPNLGAVVPQINGPLSVNGTARQTPRGWQLDTTAQGPAGTQAQIAGVVGNDGRLDIDITGNAPLGLTAPFLAPRVLQGQARFDLALDGPAGLGALSGTIRTSDAKLTAPTLRVGLEGIVADIRLANGRAALDVTGTASGGGRVAVTGGIGLNGPLPADLGIRLDGLVLTDPRLYRTSLDGDLRLSGPLTGGAVISGDIAVGETTVTVPSTGLTSIGDIPPITHQGAPQDSRATRRRAGLLEEGAAADPTGGGGGRGGFGLDIAVSAPGRIFVRGRGLDAELGGSLRLTGTTSNIISAGRFELARGRLDILGKRFDLEEGSAQFQGDLVPFIRFVSTTSTETGTASIIVEGPANAPEVSFESSPAGPQDEVLAQLLFGRNLAEISAFQALQLASAVATLAGRGGVGVVGNLRDRFGLDDLDVTTTDSGETALRVGKYLTDNVYTDVTAASDGTGEVSLNIDLTPSLKGKATLGSDGNSALGVFFERDY